MANSQNIEVLNTEKLGPSIGPYSKAIKSNGFLFISGQIGTDPATKKLASASFETEAHQIMKNISFILSEAGLSLNDLVAVTIYLKDMQNYSRINDVYKSYFSDYFPTRTCIAVADLPAGASLEITATAALR